LDRLKDCYVDEQAWRYNYRNDEDGEPSTDAQRFAIGIHQIVAKRLTYAELTGKIPYEQSSMRSV
jgi:hypothetical protein